MIFIQSFFNCKIVSATFNIFTECEPPANAFIRNLYVQDDTWSPEPFERINNQFSFLDLATGTVKNNSFVSTNQKQCFEKQICSKPIWLKHSRVVLGLYLMSNRSIFFCHRPKLLSRRYDPPSCHLRQHFRLHPLPAPWLPDKKYRLRFHPLTLAFLAYEKQQATPKGGLFSRDRR